MQQQQERERERERESLAHEQWWSRRRRERGERGVEGVERSRAVHMNGFEIVSGSGTTVERFYRGRGGKSWPYFYVSLA
jgi:hypothetical protein